MRDTASLHESHFVAHSAKTTENVQNKKIFLFLLFYIGCDRTRRIRCCCAALSCCGRQMRSQLPSTKLVQKELLTTASLFALRLPVPCSCLTISENRKSGNVFIYLVFLPFLFAFSATRTKRSSSSGAQTHVVPPLSLIRYALPSSQSLTIFPGFHPSSVFAKHS
jgi:hypothetical protein